MRCRIGLSRLGSVRSAHWALSLLLALAIAGCEVPIPVELPQANFTATPRAGGPGLTVRFSDASVSATAPIAAWAWTFGDGGAGNGPNPSHRYQLPGSYSVSLTVTTSQGSHTATRNNYIVVTEPVTFDPIDADGGIVSSGSASFAVPAGAVTQEIAVGISRQNAGFPLRVQELTQIVSDTYTITHNNTTSRFNGSAAANAELTLPFAVDVVPLGDRNPGKVFILARLADGLTVPISGRIAGNLLVAQITDLPHTAQYVAVYRPGGVHESVQAPSSAKIASSFAWNDRWHISTSENLLNQLTALRIGKQDRVRDYDRRDFSAADRAATLTMLADAVRLLHEQYVSGGFRSPLLAGREEGFSFLFYNMSERYTPAYEDFLRLPISTRLFGQIVIDPLQLLQIAIHTSQQQQASQDPLDVAREISPESLFAEELLRSVAEGYDFPKAPLTSTVDRDPAGNRRAFSPLDGLGAAIARYLGLEANNRFANAILDDFENLDLNNDGVVTSGEASLAVPRMSDEEFRLRDLNASGHLNRDELTYMEARGQDAGEYLVLSNPLFFPFDSDVDGYDAAGHEFLVYLDRHLQVQDPVDYIAHTRTPVRGLLEEVRSRLAGLPNGGRGLSFNQIAREAVIALDRSLAGTLGITLGQAYWDFARARAIENGDDALLRPSDEARMPYTLNEDRFGEDAIVEAVLPAPSQAITLSGDTHDALENIPPLSSRIIVLDVHPLATELTLTFNRSEWLTDSRGNSLDVAVYRPGVGGETLPANASTLVVEGFSPDPESCYDQVILLVSNTSLNQFNSLELEAEAFPELNGPENEVLRDFVYSCDPTYDWSLTSVSRETAFTTSRLSMTSGTWRGTQEVNETEWRHIVSVGEPLTVSSTTAMLFVSGGSFSSSPANIDLIKQIAQATQTVVALIQNVPSQPLIFANEVQGRTEDEIIAYSYDKYLDSFDAGKTDMTWPALLPMTRSAVRAMDTVQDYLRTRANNPINIDRFVVLGASKRGWTTWLTAAADPRVHAIAPLVIDVLNMEIQINHHFAAYGFYSDAIEDYVNAGVFERFGTPASDSLLSIVDPYAYRSRLTMPKLISNSSGDQFFLPDSSQFYYNQLPGENYLYFAPNTDHSLSGAAGSYTNTGTFSSLLAWYNAVVAPTGQSTGTSFARPQFSWQFLGNNGLRVTTATTPIDVKLWTAANPNTRDFRLETIGAVWTSTTLTAVNGSPNVFEGNVTVPTAGWRAFFIQLTFPSNDPALNTPYSFTTEVRVVPDILPF
ncbi:MAG: PKD domain-containing protein [Candidatus Hydrogenedentes bacterium]|nr:PKD domain-containing protein [Candidatus Hydrogenedentota bacterium]